MTTPNPVAAALESDYERGKREAREEFEREQQAAAPRAEQAAPPEPTHYLALANGKTVDHFGAIPTHVQEGDGPLVPVLAAYAR